MVATTPSWLTLDSEGGATQYWVDPTAGSDSNDGLSIGAPKATLAAAIGAATDNSYTIFNLKRGEVFPETITLTKGGSSETSPFAFRAYGSGARPQLQSSGTPMTIGTDADNCLFRSVAFWPASWALNDAPATGGNAIRCRDYAFTNLYFEDCEFAGYETQINRGAAAGTNFVARGCVFREGIYPLTIGETAGVLVEYCLFDDVNHNGGGPTPHWLYLQDSNSGTQSYENNIFTRGNEVAGGVEHRGDGSIGYNNLFHDMDQGIWCGDTSSSETERVFYVRYNVFDGLRADGNRAVVVQSCGDDTVWSELNDNLVCHRATSSVGREMFSLRVAVALGVRKMQLYRNVVGGGVDEAQAFNVSGGTTEDIDLRENRVSVLGLAACVISMSTNLSTVLSQDNQYFTDQSGTNRFSLNGTGVDISGYLSTLGDPTSGGSASVFSDPSFTDDTRSSLTYRDMVESTSGSTTADLVASIMAAMSFDAWDEDYSAVAINDWIRAGFDMPALADSGEVDATAAMTAPAGSMAATVDVTPVIAGTAAMTAPAGSMAATVHVGAVPAPPPKAAISAYLTFLSRMLT